MKKIIFFVILTVMCLTNSLNAQDVRNEINPLSSKIVGNNQPTDAIFDVLRNHNVDSLVTSAAGYGVV